MVDSSTEQGPLSLDATKEFGEPNGPSSSGGSTQEEPKETAAVEDERNRYRSIHGIKVRPAS